MNFSLQSWQWVVSLWLNCFHIRFTAFSNLSFTFIHNSYEYHIKSMHLVDHWSISLIWVDPLLNRRLENLIRCRHQAQTHLGRRICGRLYRMWNSVPISTLWPSSAIKCHIFLSIFVKLKLDRIKPMPEPILICLQWGPAALTLGHFCRKWSRYQSHVYENSIFRIRAISPRGRTPYISIDLPVPTILLYFILLWLWY